MENEKRFDCAAFSQLAYKKGDRLPKHTPTLSKFKDPLPVEEIREIAEAECRRLYPEADGWHMHSTAIAPFNAAQLQ